MLFPRSGASGSRVLRSYVRGGVAVPASARPPVRLAGRIAQSARLIATLFPLLLPLTARPIAPVVTPPPAVPDAAALLPPSPGFPFPQKQTLTYAADWRVFPAGTATVHLESDGALERVTVTGDSQGAINLLFRVSDRFQSTFNRTTGCSQSFSRQIMEGRRQVDSDQAIDGARRTTSYDERNLVSHIHTRQTATIPACATDMLSGIFYGGSQSLELGSLVHLPVVAGNHVTNATMRVEARESVRTPTTTYHAVRVQVTADAGTIRNRGKLWIWYSDDQRHIPVQMRVRLFWGTLTFRLTSIESK